MIKNLSPFCGLLVASLTLCVLLVPERASALLTYDLRVSDGGKIAYASSAGQTVTLELFAQVTGAPGNSGAENFQEGWGSLLSSMGGNIAGNLTSSLLAPFNAPSSQAGVSQTLDGDSDLDVGSNQTVHNDDFIFARSATPTPAGGVAITNGVEFKIATFTFTVTSVVSALDATPITLNFRVPVFSSGLEIEALWTEDGNATNSNGLGGGLQPTVGSAVQISAVPEPSTCGLLAFAAAGFAARRRRRS